MSLLLIYYTQVKMLLEFLIGMENRGHSLVFGVMAFKHLETSELKNY